MVLEINILFLQYNITGIFTASKKMWINIRSTKNNKIV